MTVFFFVPKCFIPHITQQFVNASIKQNNETTIHYAFYPFIVLNIINILFNNYYLIFNIMKCPIVPVIIYLFIIITEKAQHFSSSVLKTFLGWKHFHLRVFMSRNSLCISCDKVLEQVRYCEPGV